MDDVQIEVEEVGKDTFRVRVQEGGSRTTHRVTVTSEQLRQYGGHASAEDLLTESFRFLLEREPKESILQAFELSVIERYFPEYPTEIRKRSTGHEASS